MKNKYLNCISKITIGVILFILLLAMTVIFSVNANISSYDSFAADPIYKYEVYSPSIFSHSVIEKNTSYFTSYYQIATGEMKKVNTFRICIDDASWGANLLNNDGEGLILLTRTIGFQEQVTVGTDYYENNREFVQEAIVSHVSSSQVNTAYVESATLVGKNFKGEAVNTSINFASAPSVVAGIYTLQNVKINYKFATSFDFGDRTLTSPSDNNGSITVNLTGFTFVFYSMITLDKNQLSLYSDNFGLAEEDRMYTSENMRKLVEIQNGDYFNFSSDTRKYVKSIGSGLGSFASTSQTNLAGLASYLNVVWYDKFIIDSETGSFRYDVISNDKEIKNAGTYGIKLESNLELEYSFQSPIFVCFSPSEEFCYELVIERKTLKLPITIVTNQATDPVTKYSVESVVGFNMFISKSFDNNNDATIMFSNEYISSSDWSNILGGFAVDFEGVDGRYVFNFTGSKFRDAKIEDPKNLYCNISMLDVEDRESAAYGVSVNYQPVPYVNGTACLYNKNYIGYELGPWFAITPTELMLHFSAGPDIEGKAAFPGFATYGDYLYASDFIYKNYIVMPGCNEISLNGGVFEVPEHNDWRVVTGTTANTPYQSYNTLYINVVPAQKNNDLQNANFIDADGNKYIVYNNRFFAGQYFFIYEAKVVYVGGSSVNLTITDGQVKVPALSGTIDFKIIFDKIQSLEINKKTVNVILKEIQASKGTTDNTEKVYDGTTNLFWMNVTSMGLLEDDKNSVLEFAYTANFSYPGVGEAVPIIYNFFLQRKGDVMSTTFQNTVRSYEIDTTNIKNETELVDINTGKITPRPLNVEFELNGNTYTREYQAGTYIAVKGLGIPEGQVYYYMWSGKDGNKESGFCDEEELETRYAGCIWITIVLSGFLEGYQDGDTWIKPEGFDIFNNPIDVYNEGMGDYNNFLINKTSGNIYEYTVLTLDSYLLMNWYTTINTPEGTRSMLADYTLDSGTYRLYLNGGQTISNYVLTPKNGQYIDLEIKKLDVVDSDIIIYEDTTTNYMEYKNASFIEQLFDSSTGKLSITAHKEYSELKEKYLNGDGLLTQEYADEFLRVERFVPDCEETSHKHYFSQEEIKQLVYAGKYIITLTIPATTNYKPYEKSFVLTIDSKEVIVYMTLAMRYYGDDEVVYTNYAYVDDINDHVKYVDYDGNILEEGASSGGNKVYVYNGNLESGNYILYAGFIGDERIDESDNEQKHAIYTIQLPNGKDAAGNAGVVEPQGALKHNYKFTYEATNLFVKRKPLEIIIDDVHVKDYTGEQVLLPYAISDNDPGVLDMYVLAYTSEIGGEPIEIPRLEDGAIDTSKTEAILAGEYILSVGAKPYGDDSDNYIGSENRKVITVTINRILIEIQESSVVEEKLYTGKEAPYELRNFNDYFAFYLNDNTDRNYVQTGWGSMTVLGIKDADGNPMFFTEDGVQIPCAINVGTYTVAVLAVIADEEQDNIFFEVDKKIVYEKTFEIALTISKAQNYDFSVTKSEGITENNNYYSMTYNGYDETDGDNAITFGYNLYFLGEDKNEGRINVVVTINDYLYAMDGVMFDKNNADDVKKANEIAKKISTVKYNIANRTGLKNCSEYKIKYYINDPESINYDNNYISFTKEYFFAIQPRVLSVYLTFNEDQFDPAYVEYIPYKIFATSNDEFMETVNGKKKYDFEISGWAREEGTEEAIALAKQGMTIDWSEAPDDATVNADCRISSMGGTTPDNYVFDHSATVVLTILPADSQILVYGECDFDLREGKDDSLIASFDKIYKYEEIQEGAILTKNVVPYENSDNLTTSEKLNAINSKYYYNYTKFQGKTLQPEVLRLAEGVPINTYAEDIGTDGIRIRLIGKLNPEIEGSLLKELKENGILAEGFDINKIAVSCSTCQDMGEYVFAVSVKASQNYKAIPETYYYMRVSKSVLTVEVVTTADSDTVSKVYDGRYVYPYFNIRYSGFVGVDNEYPSYKNVFAIKHVSEYVKETAQGIQQLGLIHPYYEILDVNNNVITPLNVGTYKVRLLIGEEYGIADNYDIEVVYQKGDGGANIYPSLIIERRAVGVMPGNNIQKVYDSTTKVPEGIITADNYIFIAVKGDVDSGLVEGDELELILNLAKSRFARKDVLDENGNRSIVNVKAYYNIDTVLSNGNYVLKLAEELQDEQGTYINLNGTITPARAEVQFYSDADFKKIISIRHEVTYDAHAHPVYPLVRGVLTEEGVFETVTYSLTYICETIKYESEYAPTLAERYEVKLLINDSNYVNTQRGIELIINKAEVNIVFGGDKVQTYGSISGLTATAFGVEGYTKNLTILYYDLENRYVSDITTANAGEYIAKAIHEENANYKHCEELISFTIKRREVNINIDVRSSYVYTGRGVEVNLYFSYNNIVFRPELEFYDENGGLMTVAPINVGKYSVKAKNSMQNFDILDTYLAPFSITMRTVTVKAKDLTVINGERIVVDYTLTGAVNNEKADKVFSVMPLVEYYSATTGAKINGEPIEEGIYKIVPYGGVSQNYVPVYEYGILTVNKQSVQQVVKNNKNEEIGEVELFGSFGADISLVVKTTDTLEYNQYITSFDSIKLNNEELTDLGIYDIYYLKLSNDSITTSDGGMMRLRISAKYYFDSFDENYSGEYKVARISSDGSVTMLTAERDGDYLIITTDKLEAFALLGYNDNMTISNVKSFSEYDWLLYVGIAVGVILIGIAIVIVKVRA